MGKIQARASYGKIPTENLWFKSVNGDIWNIDYFDPYKSRLEGIIILKPRLDHSIMQRIDAREAVWSINKWEFIDGYIRTFDINGIKSTQYFEKKFFTTPETPEILSKAHKRPEEMRLSELYKKIQIQVELENGSNQLIIIASNSAGTKSKTIEIIKKGDPPFITIRQFNEKSFEDQPYIVNSPTQSIQGFVNHFDSSTDMEFHTLPAQKARLRYNTSNGVKSNSSSSDKC